MRFFACCSGCFVLHGFFGVFLTSAAPKFSQNTAVSKVLTRWLYKLLLSGCLLYFYPVNYAIGFLCQCVIVS